MSATLLQVWKKTLERRAGDRAVAEAATGNALGFRELDIRAVAWRETHAAHLRPGDVVVFALANGLRWFEVFLGLASAGAVAVPLDPGEPAEAQRRIAERLRAAGWWDGNRLVPLPNPRRFRAPDLCLIKLTSGTTGRPRPLVFTAAQMLADARQVTRTMGIAPRDLNHALIPLGHSYGLGNLTFPLLAHGVPLVCGSAALPHAIAEDFARWRPTVFPSVPAVFRALLAAELPPGALASLRLPISAGAPLPPEVARDFAARFRRRIHNFYGSSETGGIAYDRTGGATLRGSVGRAMYGVSLARERGGRLRVSSAAVFTYGNRARRGAHGAWSPPDRANLDARGEIALLGRRGVVVKIGARRVSLAEVAARVRALGGVRDVWVAIAGDREPLLGAAVATTRSVSELRAELQASTAAWKIPKRWALFPELPLTPRGKIDTRVLHEAVFGRA